MNPELDRLLQSALALPGDDLMVFLAALNASVEERGLRAPDGRWIEEVRRRSDEYDAGGVRPIPWSEVKRLTRARAAEGPSGG